MTNSFGSPRQVARIHTRNNLSNRQSSCTNQCTKRARLGPDLVENMERAPAGNQLPPPAISGFH